MFDIKFILEPKIFLEKIPENKISGNLIFLYLLFYSFFEFFQFKAVFSDPELKNFFTSASSNDLLIGFSLLLIAFILQGFLFFLIVILVTKLFLKLKKVFINWKKILNIFLYVNILWFVLQIICIIIFKISFWYVMFSGDNINERFVGSFMNILEIYGGAFCALLLIIMYVYMINLEIKHKKLN